MLRKRANTQKSTTRSLISILKKRKTTRWSKPRQKLKFRKRPKLRSQKKRFKSFRIFTSKLNWKMLWLLSWERSKTIHGSTEMTMTSF
jgi:hypothetical protein